MLDTDVLNISPSPGMRAFIAALAVFTTDAAEPGALQLQIAENSRFSFTGPVGDRVSRNIDEWLLRAPSANPGMLEMFRVRDRQPVPQLVPWAGEFVGKYLISAIQALRMSDDPRLRAEVDRVVRELISTQAGDGYLGPFREKERLRGNWDLWGHYHCIEALLMWHGQTGDRPALTAARRAGDLVCSTFLDGSLRVHDAGSHEMNMAVIHALGHLYRLTNEPRYLRMMREIEKDWERSGDYLRAGLDGREFFASPLPRWESLHDLQGLVELYRITGEKKYRDAFERHWRSIARNDIHNNGAFSSGEQATGNQYAPGAIETCCTVAWMAVSIDMLRLTGDPQIAEFLELATFNGGVGAQHPTGRWWTYNTPMDGVREASAHSIVFQSRAGTPELNCCSVNAPRALGMLSEWIVMLQGDAIVINSFIPGSYQVALKSGKKAVFEISGNYPISGEAGIVWKNAVEEPLRVKVRRVPGLQAGGPGLNPPSAQNPAYVEFQRSWKAGDTISLNFDMKLRAVPGDREMAGRVSLYRGPILLAYDQGLNSFDDNAIPPVDLTRLGEAKIENTYDAKLPMSHWLEVKLPSVRLCDFATAGARGVRYRSWLPAAAPQPPSVATRIPEDGSVIGKAGSWFRWTGPKKTNEMVDSYRLEIFAADSLPDRTSDADGSKAVLRVDSILQNRVRLGEPALNQLSPGGEYRWRVVAIRGGTETASVAPWSRFRFEPDARFIERPGMILREGADGILIHEKLNRAAAGRDGAAGGAVELNGTEMLKFPLEEFPSEDYSMAVWVNALELPANRLGQVFSSWAGGSDDPLRVVFDNGRLFARIEKPGQGSSTEGVALSTNQWHHIAAVKNGNRLHLFVDGKRRGETSAPADSFTSSQLVALGGNPKYSGNEFLKARFADFRFFGKALSDSEIKELAR